MSDLETLDPEAREIIRALEVDGRVLNIFRTLVHHPKLLKRWLVFGTHILGKSSLDDRDRELLILRTAHRCASVYEWEQHVAIARAAGVSDEEIADVAVGPGAPRWEPLDAALLRAADELLDDHKLSEATWEALRERYDDRQMLDAMFTIGQYAMLAGALNSLGVPLEDDLE